MNNYKGGNDKIMMRISVSLFSFNPWLRNKEIKIKECIEFCGSLDGVDAVDMIVYYWDNEEKEKKIFRKILEDNGLKLSSYGIGNNFAHPKNSETLLKQMKNAKKGIDTARELNAPCLRIFGGSLIPQDMKKHHNPEWGVWGSTLPQNISKHDALSVVIENLYELVEYAKNNNVVLGIEQHGELPGTIDELERVLNEINSPYLKAILDLGSFYKSGEDPLKAIEKLGKDAIRVQFKDVIVSQDTICRPLGTGDMNFNACVSKLREVGFNKYITLEVEGIGGSDTFGVDVKESVQYINSILKS